ncbi:fungal-specific transcription factor domain-containing protein [Pilobolus umbonatus]|nr:fungal-specific transcription factor domain-containing protein [Pilobolus umbonatus]
MSSLDSLGGNLSESDIHSGEKKKRITRACDVCRRKKIKCYLVKGQPCSNCISYGTQCEFNEGAKKRGPPKGYVDALEKRIRKMETTLMNGNTHQSPQATSTTAPSSPSNISSTGSDFTGSNDRKNQAYTTDNVHYLGDMSSFQFFSNKIRLDANGTKWKGRRIKKFGKQMVLIDEESEKTYHTPTPQLLPHIKSIHHWIYSVSGIDRITSDRLLKIYFANVHCILPVINKSRFLQQYRDQSDSYPPAELLNAMFGAAARYVESDALTEKSNSNTTNTICDVPAGWSDEFFGQAKNIILKSSMNPTLSKVQSIILIHNHSGSLDSKSSGCWLLIGLAIRLAQGLGLNRSCEDWDIPDSEKQTRKRIWWSLYVADRFHSASLGRPISIRDEDNDVFYPDATSSWEETLDIPTSEKDDMPTRFPSAILKPPKIEGRVGIYQLFIELIKLSEILGRILQGLYTPKAKKIGMEKGSALIVTRLDHELTEWRYGFPQALKAANFGDVDEGHLAPVKASVLLCYYSLLILLHRPFIESIGHIQSERSAYSSFLIGTSAAKCGIQLAEQMTLKDFLMFPYSFSLYPVLQCCLIHIYNTKNPDPLISSPAKALLIKGIAVISKLRVMSNTAQKLYQLLNSLAEKQGIETSVTTTERSSHSNDDYVNNFRLRTSDVGRGNIMTQQPSTRLPYHGIHPQPSFQAHLINQLQPTNLHTSPYSVETFQHYLSQFVAPPAMDDILSVSHTSQLEIFSLRQFGFTMDNPNSLDYVIPGLSSLPEKDPSDPYIHIAEGVFRNNPNNPFFSIPASMDWAEWNEWNQTEQGNSIWPTPQ